ncbi:MAG TPA: YncE family protein [Chloroflexota bacterium]
MRYQPAIAPLGAILAVVLAACGGGAAVPASAPPASAPKPAASTPASAAPASAAASAKPAASGAASAAASDATASAKPKPTLVPDVPADTTTVTFTTTAIPGTEGKAISSDIIDMDQEAHMVYAADRTTGGVDVFDATSSTPRFAKTIKTSDAPNGVIVAKNVGRLVAGLNDGNVASIDLATGQVAGSVSTGGKKRADELDYDPKDKKVYAANSDDGFMSAIDMTSFKVVKKIDGLGDALEQPRYDAADGMVYLTGSGTNTLYQIDPAKDEVTKKIAMPNGCKPSGIWMNPKTNIGLISCDPHPIVWDFNAQKMVASLDQTGKGDQVTYDAKTDLFFLGEAGWNHGPHIGIAGGSPPKFITNIPTPGGNHNNSVLDETNMVVYAMGGNGMLSFALPAKVLGSASAAASGSAAAKPAASAKPSA